VKKIGLALLLIAVIALSGCIQNQPVKTDPNNGLVISSFSVDPTKVDKAGSVLVLMDLENLGGITAGNITLNLYGVDDWTTGGAAITPITISDMRPPDPITDSPGDFQTKTIALTAPSNLPPGVQANYPITARVTFSYHTTGTISIPSYSKTLYKIMKDKGQTIDGSAKVENTYAPIQVALSKGSTPLVVDDTPTGPASTDYGYLIEFVNVGDGWPISTGASGGRVGVLRGTISVSGLGVTLKECFGQTASGNSVTVSNFDMTTMRSSGRVPVACTVTLTKGTSWTSTASGNVMFKIDMYYDYYVEKTANVMVWGGTG
jgi:hypothetical protein